MADADHEVHDKAIHRRLWRGGTWVVVCRVVGIGLAFALNVVLTRLLSPGEFGMFLFLLTALGFCATLGRFGLDRALLRFLSECLARKDHRGVRRVLVMGLRIGTISSFISAGVCSVFLGFFGDSLFGVSLSPRLWLMTGVGLMVLALLQITAETFRGFHQLRFASIFDAQNSGPLVNLIFITLLIAVAGQVSLSIEWALGLYVLSLIVVFPVALFLLIRTSKCPGQLTCEAAESNGGANLSFRDLITFCVPIALSQVVTFISAQGDIWIAGACCPPEQLALFGAARRLILTISLPLGMINLTVLSAIPELHAQGRLFQLQRILQTAATVAALPSIPAMVALIAMPETILTAAFGSFYGDAATVLIILGFGQIANVLTGSCGNSLIMTGHHNVNLLTNLAAAILLFTIAPGVATNYGITGLAIVSASVFALQNLSLLLAARRFVGVWTNATVTSLVQRVFVPATLEQ